MYVRNEHMLGTAFVHNVQRYRRKWSEKVSKSEVSFSHSLIHSLTNTDLGFFMCQLLLQTLGHIHEQNEVPVFKELTV